LVCRVVHVVLREQIVTGDTANKARPDHHIPARARCAHSRKDLFTHSSRVHQKFVSIKLALRVQEAPIDALIRAVLADLAERLIHALSQIRRGSETSAFAAPPEIAAQIGCPIGEFPAVLRSLGLKPAEKDKSGAVKLWRFAANRQRKPQREEQAQPAPTGPFAALAALVAPAPALSRRRRRRPRAIKQPDKQVASKAAT
jgi:hypothetical protein